jgi:parvulin-like peptidyl-prolyl isomerase
LFSKDQRAKAEEVKGQLQDGADFAELAREISRDPQSAEQGGDLGCWEQNGALAPNLEEDVFEAEEGKIVGPVETKSGLQLFEVTEIQSKRTASLEEVEPQIRQELAAEQREEEFQAWVHEQQEKRDVEYHLPGYEPRETAHLATQD